MYRSSMKKSELLDALVVAVQEKVLTRSEIEQALHGVWGSTDTPVPSPLPVSNEHSNLPAVLYTIGGIIVLLGITFFVSEHWSEMQTYARVLVTLGAGISFFLSGVLIAQTKSLIRLADSAHLLAGVLIPSGIFVWLTELDIVQTTGVETLVYALLTVFFLVAQRLFHRSIHTAFSLIFGTWAMYAGVSYLLDLAQVFDLVLAGRIIAYLTLSIGVSYLCIGYALRHSLQKLFTPWLYFGGSVALLGAGMFLQGYSPDQYLWWEILYPGILFGAFVLSVRLRSIVMLIVSALYLVGFLVKITFEYFSASMDNASILLVIFGFLVIGIGYLVYHLNQKYIASNVASGEGAS